MKKELYNKVQTRLKEFVVRWGKAPVYMVGGCVRDEILGELVKDVDLCVDLEDGATKFCEYLESNGLVENVVVYQRYGTSKFTLPIDEDKVDIECVMPRIESYKEGPRKPDQVNYATLEEDARRRDFCCNALYKNIVTGEVLDPTGYGLEDLNYKILRTPILGKETFIDDPLRMLRAFRFAAEKNFTILPEVFKDIKPYPEYSKLSMERVNSEFSRILLTSKSVDTIIDLHKTRLLEYIIPELEESWGFNQRSHYHSMNLTEHTLSVLSFMITKYPNASLELRLSALLHDIAKYKCYQQKESGELSFKGHDLESSRMAEKILVRLKYSRDTIDRVKYLIENHMVLKSLYDKEKDIYTGSDSQTRRFIRKLGSGLGELVMLIDSDNNSHAPEYNMPGQIESFLRSYYRVISKPVVKECPIDGKEIMRILSIGPGPAIRELKEIIVSWLDEEPSLEKDVIIYNLKDYIHLGFWGWENSNGEKFISLVKDESSERVVYKIEDTDRSPEIDKTIKYYCAKDYPGLYNKLMLKNI